MFHFILGYQIRQLVDVLVCLLVNFVFEDCLYFVARVNSKCICSPKCDRSYHVACKNCLTDSDTK